MTDLTGINWDEAFANMGHIPNGASFPEIWSTRAAAFRETASAKLDLAYGATPRERYDLFLPAGEPLGLVVFVHGGFWIGFDKSSWSDLAQGPLSLGWAVAMPSYTLAPQARIRTITQQIGAAITEAANQISGPIRLAGHSAGGHLVTRMLCADTPLSPEIQTRIAHVVSISGVHDLRPLQLTAMNEKLQIDPEEAAAESPTLNRPDTQASVTAWVGAAERPEFLRQSALLPEAWGAQNKAVRLIFDPDRHHFDVVDGLKTPDHPLTQTLLGD